MNKRISKQEVLENIKVGDLVYVTFNGRSEHDGWRMCTSKNTTIGLNCELSGSYTDNLKNSMGKISKYVPLSEINRLSELSSFMHTFKETFISDYIYDVYTKSDKEVQLEQLINKLSKDLDDAREQLNKARGDN